METMEVKKLSAGTIYKLIFTGSLIGFVFICLIFGILGATGMEVVTWNGEHVTGPKALLVGPLIGALMSLFFTAIFGSITALGLWLYSLVKPVHLIYFKQESS